MSQELCGMEEAEQLDLDTIKSADFSALSLGRSESQQQNPAAVFPS